MYVSGHITNQSTDVRMWEGQKTRDRAVINRKQIYFSR